MIFEMVKKTIKNRNKNDIQDDTPTMGSLQRDGETDDFVVSLQLPTIQIWMDRSEKNIMVPAMPTPQEVCPSFRGSYYHLPG